MVEASEESWKWEEVRSKKELRFGMEAENSGFG